MRLILFFVGASVVLPGIIESATYNLNKVICRSFDKSFCEFETCEMKMKRRGAAVFNMNLTLHKKPIDRIILNLQLFKKSNGYRPFLINQTIDFCYYMRNPTAYMFFQSFHKTFFSASNLNHTCPYNVSIKHDSMQQILIFWVFNSMISTSKTWSTTSIQWLIYLCQTESTWFILNRRH